MAGSPQTTTGTLRIGDQWNAINIIAHSQTHPLKAICELTENAIDAGARHVRILRRRHKGQVQLEVSDDGRGVAADESGAADFERIATHLCDSMKRHLDARQKRGVHGEFGIGLLSFWSLGDELRMISGAAGGPLRELHLTRGKRHYTIRPARGRLATGGTRVIVGPLLETTKSLVTGEKIGRYLSAELRDRIRLTGVTIDVVDSVARKELRVTPREFDGERLDIPRRYATPLGDVTVEVYARGESDTGEGGVALCKDGTRVLTNIMELLAFQHAPWNDRRLAGLVDFEPLMLAPGTRSGIVADAALEALVAAAAAIEQDIAAALASREQAEAERASRQILKQVHKAFASALSELPAEDYLFFDIPKQAQSLQTQPGAAGVAIAAGEDGPTSGDPGAVEPPPTLFPVEPGSLSTVQSTPRRPRRSPGGSCRLGAVARDEAGTAIPSGVEFSWRLVAGEGAHEAAAESCTVTSAVVGLVGVEVVARQEGAAGPEATDRVDVKFLDDAAGDEPGARGLPAYRLEPEHGQPWRSRYDSPRNEIVINSAHRDFLASRSSSAKHRRYIGKLYAKEVVLSNFPHESPAEVMERLIEVTLRTEDAL
ncbi:MAG: ATP-binding protein [Planctomycetia bacterium]